ncbi:MAG: hypothetical protein GY859_00365 [Desulfobacterales bacterium]|nr:hypothetical protein [Desulfobacterales bacterium]
MASRIDRGGGDSLTRLIRGGKSAAVAVHGAVLGGGMKLVLARRCILAPDHPPMVIGLPEARLVEKMLNNKNMKKIEGKRES